MRGKGKRIVTVLEHLRKHKLFLKLEKCFFNKAEVEYLGMIVKEGHVGMDLVKLAAIQEWKPPSSVKGVWLFIGFCNFYQKFIPNFSTIAQPLHNLTKKGAKWDWTTECNATFKILKATFIQGPVLALPDTTKPFMVMTDASLIATGAVLMQVDFNGDLHPCAFLSKTLSAAERKYDIFDWELLAVIHALIEWKHYLQGIGHPVIVVTDHKNLSYFKQPHKLSWQQAQWMLFLQDFDLVFLATPGSQMEPADALSCKDEVDTSNDNQDVILLPPVTIFLLFRHILLVSFNTSHRYWKGLHPSNETYLVVTGPTSFFLSHL